MSGFGHEAGQLRRELPGPLIAGPIPDSPLWDMENGIISPHTSSNSPDLEISRMEIFKENLRRFLNDEPFIRVCDKLAGY